jgi:outer membrane translocation and assembly module TamA
MYVGIHYNTGRVWQRTDKIQFVSFLHSLGLSYSFNTPLGPLSIGIADLFSIDESLELYKGEAKTYLSFGIKL